MCQLIVTSASEVPLERERSVSDVALTTSLSIELEVIAFIVNGAEEQLAFTVEERFCQGIRFPTV